MTSAVEAHLKPRALSLALIGCGHIGGSLSLSLRAAKRLKQVIGFDRDPRITERALGLGICDEVAPSIEACVAHADVVVLAIPVRALGEVCTAIAKAVRAGAIVTDVGSLKGRVVRICEDTLGGRARFVGGHPMAGTEKSGPEHAQSRLFKGRTVILTPTGTTSAAALRFVTDMWRALDAKVVELDPEAHDHAVAALSHLPHLVAFALCGAATPEAAALAGLAGGSFTDGTRVASSAATMWTDLLIDNRAAITPLLEAFRGQLAALQKALDKRDAAGLLALIERAAATRKTIVGA
jgi:prephenate dehydrogenase